MKNFIRCLLFAPGLLFFGTLKAQTADDIITQHITAIGGQDVISKINTIYEEATLEVMGNEAPDTIYLVNGKGYKTITSYQGQSIIQCYTDSGGWTVNPMAGSSVPTPLSAADAKEGQGQIYVGGVLDNYAAKGYKADLQGTEKVGDSITAYKIVLTAPDSTQTTFYIDSTTHYLVKEVATREMQGNPVQVNITLSNFKKTDSGLVMPFQMDMDFGQFTLTYVTSKVEFNKTFDPGIFTMPQS